MKVGPCVILTRIAPSLAGEAGCVRGQVLVFTEGATGWSRRIFPPKKRPSGALWGIPLQQQLQSPLHPVQGVCTSTGECLHLTSEGTETTDTNRGSVPTHRSLCEPTGECPHLISEGTETTGTRESENQGRLCAHTHSPEKAYHKKKSG